MNVTITIQQEQNTTVLTYSGMVLLSEALHDAGLTHAHPCGGRGTCGKCAVRVQGLLSPMTETERKGLSGAGYPTDGSVRLSCLCQAMGDITIYYTTTNAPLQGLSAGFLREFRKNPPLSDHAIGMAVDVGTTSVAAYLYDLSSGTLLSQTCVENPQKAKGADVISRILCALQGGAEDLRTDISDCLTSLGERLCQEAGVDLPTVMVVTGNTAMLSLATGTDVAPLSAAPFQIKRRFGEWVESVYYPPCISAYVGADMTAAILASPMCEYPDKTALLLDVGTNGEMALWHEGQLTCCSTAAGPAFEGAGISCGCLAIPGAVCRVEAKEGTLTYETIDHLPPVGLCGTGLIDTAAALLKLGVLEDSGYMEEDAPIGASGLTLTRADSRQLQLAKAAIRAGIDTLLLTAGIDYDTVQTVYLAGGFGSYLHPDTCGEIGMIPPELISKIKVLGNAAGQGASLMLLSSEEVARAEEIARMARTIDLSTSAVFMEKYVDSMMF